MDKRKNWRAGGRAIRHWENGLGREKWKDKIGKDVKPLNHVEVGEVKDEEGKRNREKRRRVERMKIDRELEEDKRKYWRKNMSRMKKKVKKKRKNSKNTKKVTRT